MTDNELLVTDCGDTIPGGGPGQLRRLMNDSSPGSTITIPACTITLGGFGGESLNQQGDLNILKDVTIQGAGSALTTIVGPPSDRVFDISSGVTAAITGVTIRNGASGALLEGGGLLNRGTLMLTDTVVRNNTEGGIRNMGTLSLTNSTVSDNSTSFMGGGILNDSGMLQLVNVAISGNSARGGGGGISHRTGNASLTNVTIGGNTTVFPGAAAGGGGILNEATMALVNVTVSGNTGIGGGIVAGGQLSVLNSTIAHNASPPFIPRSPGGIVTAGAAAFKNTIVGHNDGGDCGGPIAEFSQGHNIGGDNTCIFNGPSDRLNINASLGPLADNGGPTRTHALLFGSPAVNAGDAANCPTTDQRGVARPQGTACDVGAYEVRFRVFADVPESYFASQFVETLFATGVTGGCATAPLLYCPESPVTRGQMAVFLVKAKFPGVVPPDCVVATFVDVPCTHPFADYIYQLVELGVTAGCGGGRYCPDDSVTREQMAVFLMKMLLGGAFSPGDCTVTPFGDVPCSSIFARWIRELVTRGITAGCGAGIYCPARAVTRGEMAVFLVRTFNLVP